MPARLGLNANNESHILSHGVIPVGTVKAYAVDSVPPGFLLLDGSSLLRTDYPALFAVIGTAFGFADGNHFNLPNAQGIFIRGSNKNGSSIGGIFYGNSFSARVNDSTKKNGLGITDPGHTHPFGTGNHLNTFAPGAAAIWAALNGQDHTVDNGPGAVTYTGISMSGGDFETAPASLTLTWIIKY